MVEYEVHLKDIANKKSSHQNGNPHMTSVQTTEQTARLNMINESAENSAHDKASFDGGTKTLTLTKDNSGQLLFNA